MAKNIELNILNSSGSYEVLYPKVSLSNSVDNLNWNRLENGFELEKYSYIGTGSNNNFRVSTDKYGANVFAIYLVVKDEIEATGNKDGKKYSIPRQGFFLTKSSSANYFSLPCTYMVGSSVNSLTTAVIRFRATFSAYVVTFTYNGYIFPGPNVNEGYTLINNYFNQSNINYDVYMFYYPYF